MRHLMGLVLLVLAQTVSAQVVMDENTIDKRFHPIGPSETLVSLLNQSTFVTTTEGYSGLVQFSISGMGIGSLGRGYDPFYSFGIDNGSEPKVSTATRISFGGSSVSYALSEKFLGLPEINRPFELFYSDGGGSRTIPPYSPTHSYNIVAFIRNPAELGFGFKDSDGFANNSGGWSITVTPVAMGAAVPEPQALGLIASLGLLGYVGYRRAHKGVLKKEAL